jgi:hypothetical protein
MRLELDDLTDDPTERAAFERIGRALAAGPVPVDDAAPPADLWDRIAARLGDDDSSSGSGAAPGVGFSVTSLEQHRAARAAAPTRHRTGRTLLAVAAAVLLLVAVSAVLVNRSTGGGTELVASTDLELLAGGGAGAAELIRTEDGVRLRVDVSGLSPAEAADFYELWLLAPDGSNPQSLTKFDQVDGVVEVVLPDDLSTAEFPVVDISEELDDGDETHSGKSILRGQLA